MVRKRLNENEKKGTNLQKKMAKALATGKRLIFHGSTTYTKEMDFSNRLRNKKKYYRHNYKNNCQHVFLASPLAKRKGGR